MSVPDKTSSTWLPPSPKRRLDHNTLFLLIFFGLHRRHRARRLPARPARPPPPCCLHAAVTSLLAGGSCLQWCSASRAPTPRTGPSPWRPIAAKNTTTRHTHTPAPRRPRPLQPRPGCRYVGFDLTSGRPSPRLLCVASTYNNPSPCALRQFDCLSQVASRTVRLGPAPRNGGNNGPL